MDKINLLPVRYRKQLFVERCLNIATAISAVIFLLLILFVTIIDRTVRMRERELSHLYAMINDSRYDDSEEAAAAAKRLEQGLSYKLIMGGQIEEPNMLNLSHLARRVSDMPANLQILSMRFDRDAIYMTVSEGDGSPPGIREFMNEIAEGGFTVRIGELKRGIEYQQDTVFVLDISAKEAVK